MKQNRTGLFFPQQFVLLLKIKMKGVNRQRLNLMSDGQTEYLKMFYLSLHFICLVGGIKLFVPRFVRMFQEN